MDFKAAFSAGLSAQLGAEWPDFVAAHQEAAPVSRRWNPGKTGTPDREAAVAWSDFGEYLSARPRFVADPLWHAGAYYVQEASSMLVEYLVRQLWGTLPEAPKVLDLCAAPGGKSLSVLSALPPEGTLVANEVIRSRYQILRENLAKWGDPRVATSQLDPSKIGQHSDCFDLVLVDAPCSGEGLFRRDSAAQDEWSPEQVKRCAARQQRILADVLPALKPGGYLLYSTCTFNPVENDENVAWLQQQFDLEHVSMAIPAEWGISQTTQGWQCYPHRLKGEGFYVSVLKRKGAVKPVRKSKKNARSAKAYWQSVKHMPPFLAKHTATKPAHWYQGPKGQYVYWPGPPQQDLEPFFAQPILVAGVEKGKDFIPTAELALSTCLTAVPAQLEADQEQAIAFLRGEQPALPKDAALGWTILNYKQQRLGWIKILPRRINNYHPKAWRIRTSF